MATSTGHWRPLPIPNSNGEPRRTPTRKDANARNCAPQAVSLEDPATEGEDLIRMNDHHTTRRLDTQGASPTRPEPNRYAITLAALIASAQVITEQPASPAHDYSSGFDTTGSDGDGQGNARGY